jgi:hypothetical protein
MFITIPPREAEFGVDTRVASSNKLAIVVSARIHYRLARTAPMPTESLDHEESPHARVAPIGPQTVRIVTNSAASIGLICSASTFGQGNRADRAGLGNDGQPLPRLERASSSLLLAAES